MVVCVLSSLVDGPGCVCFRQVEGVQGGVLFSKSWRNPAFERKAVYFLFLKEGFNSRFSDLWPLWRDAVCLIGAVLSCIDCLLLCVRAHDWCFSLLILTTGTIVQRWGREKLSDCLNPCEAWQQSCGGGRGNTNNVRLVSTPPTPTFCPACVLPVRGQHKAVPCGKVKELMCHVSVLLYWG